MPTETFKAFTGQEQKFIFHYLREGAVEENAWIAEKKARLKKGEGVKFLKRRHVAMEIERRKAAVELEEHKQIARDKAGLAADADKRQKVTLDKIEKRLDDLMSLDEKKHGGLVLSAIQTGLVYTGTIRSGRMERTLPPTPDPAKDGDNSPANFYDSVFDQMREAQGNVAPAPLLPTAEPGPAPLHPIPPKPPIAPQRPQPAAQAKPAVTPAKVTGVTIT